MFVTSIKGFGVIFSFLVEFVLKLVSITNPKNVKTKCLIISYFLFSGGKDITKNINNCLLITCVFCKDVFYLVIHKLHYEKKTFTTFLLFKTK